MSVIDRQGRVFGRWNLIDIFVAACVLALAPMGYFGLRVAAERRAQIAAAKHPPESIIIALPDTTSAEAAPPPLPSPSTVEDEAVVDWVFLDVETKMLVDSVEAVEWLKPGVEGVVRSDRPATVVQSVRAMSGVDRQPKKRQFSPAPPTELIVRFRVACRREDATLVCAEKPLRLGAPFTFSAKGWSVSGTIMALAWGGDAPAAL